MQDEANGKAGRDQLDELIREGKGWPPEAVGRISIGAATIGRESFDILSEIVSLRKEFEEAGGGVDYIQRRAKAWKRAQELTGVTIENHPFMSGAS